jgi:CO dehydrogenase maturation factor
MRMPERGVDAVVLVVEPTAKSLEVATRAAGLVREKSLGRLLVVANRLRNDGDLVRLTDAFPGERLVTVPDDPLVLHADRQGAAPLDAAPAAPAVRALIGLADHLVDGESAGVR